MLTRRHIVGLGSPDSPWASALSRFQKSLHWNDEGLAAEPAVVIADSSVEISALEALKKRHPRSHCPLIVVVDSAEDTEHLRKLFNAAARPIFFVDSDKPSKLVNAVESLLKQKKKPEPGRQLVLSDESEAEVEEAEINLAQMIERPTTSIESKVSKVRALIRFLKELSTVQTVEELLVLLREECSEVLHLQPPVLYSSTLQKKTRIHFFQGTKVLHKTAEEFSGSTARPHLANILERPFGKIASVPLRLRQPSAHAILYFEHAMSPAQAKSFDEFISARLEPISTALDRIFLESDLKDASLVWERTFDGVQDPIAIFDSEHLLLRANRAFSEKLRGLPADQLKDGKILFNHRVFETKTYAIHPIAGGATTNTVTHYMDVTHSHRLQKQMIQNEKMAALGHLAGNIAHELNNPLTGIRSLAQILISEVEIDTNTHKDLIEVEKAAERCQLIIRNLLEFSSGGVKNISRVSLNEIVLRTLPLLKTAMGRFQQEIGLDEDELFVMVEPQLMQQVVFNLVKNACQAMGEKGSIEIRTFKKGDEAHLEVIDTGSGIPPEIKNQIFDFFFTTKNPGQGTGLGLSMSKTIIDEFGGQISVDSEPNRGSRFLVILPLAEQESKTL